MAVDGESVAASPLAGGRVRCERGVRRGRGSWAEEAGRGRPSRAGEPIAVSRWAVPGFYAQRMDEKPPEPPVESEFRHLPPRITQEEMVPVHPIVHAIPDDQKWTDDERQIQGGYAG